MDQQTEGTELEVTHLSGINQAVDQLDVEKHEFATLQSMYPYEVGNLRRIPGRQLETLYGGQVRGIFQMHTPYGRTIRFTQTTVGVYHDGDDPAPWTPLTESVLLIEMNDYILLVDEKTLGTDGGTFTFNVWQKRDLNLEVNDAGNHASLIGANQFTLTAGTYRAHIRVPQYSVGLAYARLRNITDGITQLRSGNVYANDAAVDMYASVIIGQFVIAGTKTFEIQHRCAITKATNGYGRAVNIDLTEWYTVAEFIKVAV